MVISLCFSYLVCMCLCVCVCVCVTHILVGVREVGVTVYMEKRIQHLRRHSPST